MQSSDTPVARYRFQIQGHLESHWSSWFDDLEVTRNADGTTTLVGAVIDQAALYGLIGRLRDLGMTLLAVQHVEQEKQGA